MSRKLEAFLLVVAILQALAVRLLLGPHVRDDAYITLRYAQNVVSGVGFVYNPGEWVLGTTTPLFTLLLASLAGRFAFDPAVAAVAVGIAADTLCVLLVWLLIRRAGGAGPAILSTYAYSLLAPVVAYSVSGMETSLYTLLIATAVYAWSAGWLSVSGALSGLVVLLRPDGLLLVAAIGVYRLWQGRSALGHALRSLVPYGVPLALIVGPWLAFATAYFGSPVPQSLLAKWEDSTAEPYRGFLFFFAYFADLDERWFLPLTPLFVVGAWSVLRRCEAMRLLLLWAAAYALAFSATSKFSYPDVPFEWYNVPLLLPYAIGVGMGLHRIVATLGRRSWHRAWRVAAVASLAVGLVGLYGWVLARKFEYLNRVVGGREELYRQLALRLGERGVTGQPVAAYEIGALGYHYPGPILDLNGLVSPDSLAVSSAELIERERPPWLVSYDTMLPSALRGAPWFVREYRPVHAMTNWEGRNATLYRRYDAGAWPADPGRGLVLGGVLHLQDHRTNIELLDRQWAMVRVALYWQALAPTPVPHTVFVHILDGSGSRVAGQDNELQEGTLATTDLAPGERYLDLYDIKVPQAMLSHKASLALGAYRTTDPDHHLRWRDRAGGDRSERVEVPLLRATGLPEGSLGGVPGAMPCGLSFGGQMDLAAVAVADGAGDPAQALEVTTAWIVREAPSEDYTIFMHLLGPDARLVAQADGPPRRGTFRTTLWLPGETIVDVRRVPRPQTDVAVEGLRVGLYRLETGARVPLVGGPGDAAEIDLASGRCRGA